MQGRESTFDVIIIASQWESEIYYQLLSLGIEGKLYFSVKSASGS